MTVFLCTDLGHECANCTDASWYYRGEAPILNGDGVRFCTIECANEYDDRVRRERHRRETDWCPECGFDNHEHAYGCPTRPIGGYTYGPPKPEVTP